MIEKIKKTEHSRIRLFVTLVTLTVVPAAGAAWGGDIARPRAEVSGGSLRGAVTLSGITVFKGIPYAQPPVGKLRWREPQPALPWAGVRDATLFGAACEQNPIGTGVFIQPIAKLYGVSYQAPKVQTSEDCLTLNAWTAQWPPAGKALPVMVFFHGGSNVMGSGAEGGYDGSSLARRGVVVVTINYRLGVLGFFAHPELTRESPHHASGNYGLLDQVAALQWVHDNIANFGGDPGRVTVFGESAGSIDAGLLLCSPLASGLFQRVIMESGAVLALAPELSPRERAEQFGEHVASALGFRGPSVIDELRELPPDRLIQAAARVTRQGGDPGAVLDGFCLRSPPGQVFAEMRQLPVDMLVGNNGREMSAFRVTSGSGRPPGGGGESMQRRVRIFYGRSAAIVEGLFLLDSVLGRTRAADAWLNDVLGACPEMAMAGLHAAAGHNAYVYQFLREVPGAGQRTLGSFHGLELPYVFETFRAPSWNWLPFQSVDLALGGTIQGYWTNFARTGNPNGPGLPGWPTFGGEQTSMEFGVGGEARARAGSRPAFCDLDVQSLKRPSRKRWKAAAAPGELRGALGMPDAICCSTPVSAEPAL